ncbi:MAG: patatin-like phospholipase family protein [Legionella sp.]|nr:patatin-like phospholipase family protein [Legionella sp.]
MLKKALYLAGGGARGAYQAGVLKAIAHILQVKRLPFDSVTGVSVGSVNAAVLAECADDFPAAVDKLEYIWGDIRCGKIYKASNFEISKSLLRYCSNVLLRQRQAGQLLDTTPLREFLNENISFDKIEQNILNNYLECFEVICRCYETHQTVSFYNHIQPAFPDWDYPRHISNRCSIQVQHILASGALPLFFPPVNIDGLHYGDGSMGLVAPLRGAIRFQMDKILILGTRELPESIITETMRKKDIAFAHVLGNMMSGLFLDNLDREIEMVNHMNQIATLLSLWKKRHSTWRPITTLHLRPSQDIASLAQAHFCNMPVFLRFLLNTLGANSHSGDLLSFLLFEKQFTRVLLDLGFKDTIAVSDQVEQFFE